MDPAADGTAKLAFRGCENGRLTLRKHATGRGVETPVSHAAFLDELWLSDMFRAPLCPSL